MCESNGTSKKFTCISIIFCSLELPHALPVALEPLAWLIGRWETQVTKLYLNVGTVFRYAADIASRLWCSLLLTIPKSWTFNLQNRICLTDHRWITGLYLWCYWAETMPSFCQTNYIVFEQSQILSGPLNKTFVWKLWYICVERKMSSIFVFRELITQKRNNWSPSGAHSSGFLGEPKINNPYLGWYIRSCLWSLSRKRFTDTVSAQKCNPIWVVCQKTQKQTKLIKSMQRNGRLIGLSVRRSSPIGFSGFKLSGAGAQFAATTNFKSSCYCDDH